MKVMRDYTALYQREDLTPPGRPVPTHFTLLRINDDTHTEVEVEVEVRHLRLKKLCYQTHLRADHIKKWLRDDYLEDGKSTPPNP